MGADVSCSILSNPAYRHILHWGDEGRQIIIRKPKDLESHILPLIYKQSKFASFSRQLNVSPPVCMANLADVRSDLWFHAQDDCQAGRCNPRCRVERME